MWEAGLPGLCLQPGAGLTCHWLERPQRARPASVCEAAALLRGGPALSPAPRQLPSWLLRTSGLGPCWGNAGAAAELPESLERWENPV